MWALKNQSRVREINQQAYALYGLMKHGIAETTVCVDVCVETKRGVAETTVCVGEACGNYGSQVRALRPLFGPLSRP